MKFTIEIPVEELRAGHCTAAPIFTESGLRILEAEVILTDAHIFSICKKNIKTIIIEKEQKYSDEEIAAYKEQLIVSLREQFKYYNTEDTLRKSLMKLFYCYSMNKYES